MNENNFSSIGQIIREGANDFIRIASAFMHAMLQLPWPALLVACLLLAIFLTILPMALTLFMIFIMIKVIIALVSPKQHQHQNHSDESF